MWFYLLLGSLLLFRKFIAITVLCAYALFLVFAGGKQDSGPVLELITDPIILEFLIGFALGAFYFQPNIPRKNALLFTVSSVLVVFVAMRIAFLGDISDTPLERFISFGLPAISIVALALSLNAFIERNSIFKPLIFLGAVSYSVYLTHVLFLNMFLFAVFRVFKIDMPMILANISCFGFVILSGTLYFHIVEKKTVNAFNRFLQRS